MLCQRAKQIKIETSSKMYADLIYNIDHMRISGIEPSSVILSQRKYLKNFNNYAPKVPKEDEVKRDGVINPQYYNFNQF